MGRQKGFSVKLGIWDWKYAGLGGGMQKITVGITELHEIVSGLQNWRTLLETLKFVQNA